MNLQPSRLFVILILLLASLGCAPDSEASVWPAVFFVPHQDDELLSMGAAINQHVRAGRDVRVVLVTNGAASAVRTNMCVNKGICLTPQQFTAARNREFIASLTNLGVPISHIYFENKPDGGLTVETAESVIVKYVNLFPNGSYKTMSWQDDHVDHRSLGLALLELYDVGITPDARWYLKRKQWPGQAGLVYGWESDRSGGGVKAANLQYSVWNPKIGRYAIGWQSARSSLLAHLEDPRSRRHLPAV